MRFRPPPPKKKARNVFYKLSRQTPAKNVTEVICGTCLRDSIVAVSFRSL